MNESEGYSLDKPSAIVSDTKSTMGILSCLAVGGYMVYDARLNRVFS